MEAYRVSTQDRVSFFEDNLVPGLGYECGYAPITTDPYRVKVKPLLYKKKISICLP